MSIPDHKYMTTSELAELLRIKERKVYELAAAGDVPCSRAMGKLLFPRDQVEVWLAASSSGPIHSTTPERPAVMLGSHDPLLEWAMRESRCGLAGYFDSSLDGLVRFSENAGVAAGAHILTSDGQGWNTEAVASRFSGQPVVLVEWAKRQRGLIIAPSLQPHLKSLSNLKGKRMVARQAEAGSQILLSHLLNEAGIALTDIKWSEPARSEADAALLVQDGSADAAFGLACIARQLRLDFIPVAEERYDLLVDRRSWFEPPMQTLVKYCSTPAFEKRAATLHGYDVSNQFTVHYNG